MDAGAEQGSVHALVVVEHPFHGETAKRPLSNLSAVDGARPLNRQDSLLEVVDQETGAAVLDEVRQGAGASCDDWCPRRHGFDRHEAERLWPRSKHQGRQGTRTQLVALGRADLTEELDDALVDRRSDDFVDKIALPLIVDLGSDPKGQPGRPR